MQIHGPSEGPSEVVQGIEITRLSSGDVTLSFTGGSGLRMQCETDFDDLIRAAIAGKTLFLGEPIADDLLSRALVSYTDEQADRAWAVFEETERGTVEVTDPKTRADALVWAEINAPLFAGPLTVDRARTGVDEQLSPPAEPGRDTHRPPTGHQLPAADLLADCTGSWETADGSGRCVGVEGHQGQHADLTGRRWVHTPAGAQ